MFTKLFLSPLLLASVSYGAVLPRFKAGELHVVAMTPKAFHAPTANTITENYASLKRGSDTSSRSSSYLAAMRHANAVKKGARFARDVSPVPLVSANSGQEFLMEMTFGGEKVMMIVDTGSSDTWIIQQGFNCTDPGRNKISEPSCKFGPVFNGTFIGEKIPNQYFSIQYGDGEFVTGDMGYVDVEIGGITVKKQEVALGTAAYWNGDNRSSGLVGLAYDSLTSAYSGADPSRSGSSMLYDPVFTSMYKQNLSTPMFSLALQRGANSSGYIAFGGLPPVNFSQTFATVPIQMKSVRRSGNPSNSSAYSFYAIQPDALVYQGSAVSQNETYVVDSGTSLTLIPPEEARAINALFTPPAQLDPNYGVYVVDCNAKGPDVGFKIGGINFKINPVDMISIPLMPGANQCVTGIQDGGSAGIYILGDTFLQSVVAVFDVGAAQMRFAAHDY